jgi:hypothetical protein
MTFPVVIFLDFIFERVTSRGAGLDGQSWTLGPNFEGRNATHQMKKLTPKDLISRLRYRCRDGNEASLPGHFGFSG